MVQDHRVCALHQVLFVDYTAIDETQFWERNIGQEMLVSNSVKLFAFLLLWDSHGVTWIVHLGICHGWVEELPVLRI